MAISAAIVLSTSILDYRTSKYMLIALNYNPHMLTSSANEDSKTGLQELL